MLAEGNNNLRLEIGQISVITSSQRDSYTGVPNPSSSEVMWREAGDTWTCEELVNPWASKNLNLCIGHQAHLPVALEEDITFTFQGYLHAHILENIPRNKGSRCLCLWDREKHEKANGELPPDVKCRGSCCNKAIIALKVKDDEEGPRMTKKYKKDYDQTKIHFRLPWLGFLVVVI